MFSILSRSQRARIADRPTLGSSRKARLAVEGLEDRTTPAVAITAFDAAAGTVVFSGDQNGTTTDSLVLSQVNVGGQVLLSHNLVGSGIGNFADATDVDPSAGVAHIVLGAGTSPLITVNLGAGNDTVRLNNSWTFQTAVNVNGGAGTDTLIGLNTAQTWNVTGAASGNLGTNVTFTNFEVLRGGTANDTFNVTANFDGTIQGGGGADMFVIGAGVTAAGTIVGGGGNDTLDLSAASAITVTLTGTGSLGFSGNAGVVAFSGVNTIVGGQGSSNTLVGANVNTRWNLDGSPTLTANDMTLAFSGFENLQGGSGRDTFVISADTVANLNGGGGNDSFVFTSQAALTGSINGGAGSDTLVLAGYTSNVTVNLAAGTATGVSGGISAIENAVGGHGDDVLIGNSGNNRLVGGAGDDILIGGAGNDALFGGLGRDLLIGGLGADILFGGPGDDVLIGGSTSMDSDVDALHNLMNIWTSDDKYQHRVNDLRDALKNAAVDDNAADQLTGGDGADVYFHGKSDDLMDTKGERRIRVK